MKEIEAKAVHILHLAIFAENELCIIPEFKAQNPIC